jgi:hypothetical protein
MQFLDHCVLQFLECWMMNKFQGPSDCVHVLFFPWIVRHNFPKSSWCHPQTARFQECWLAWLFAGCILLSSLKSYVHWLFWVKCKARQITSNWILLRVFFWGRRILDVVSIWEHNNWLYDVVTYNAFNTGTTDCVFIISSTCCLPTRAQCQDVWGTGCLDIRTLDLSTSLRWVIGFILWPLLSQGKVSRRPQNCSGYRTWT